MMLSLSQIGATTLKDDLNMARGKLRIPVWSMFDEELSQLGAFELGFKTQPLSIGSS
jgi:hypothetical protein